MSDIDWSIIVTSLVYSLNKTLSGWNCAIKGISCTWWNKNQHRWNSWLPHQNRVSRVCVLTQRQSVDWFEMWKHYTYFHDVIKTSSSTKNLPFLNFFFICCVVSFRQSTTSYQLHTRHHACSWLPSSLCGCYCRANPTLKKAIVQLVWSKKNKNTWAVTSMASGGTAKDKL